MLLNLDRFEACHVTMTCTSTWGDPIPSTSLPQLPICTSYASGSALLHDTEDDDNVDYFEWESNLGVKRVRDGYEDSKMLQEHYQEEGQVNPEKRQRVSCCVTFWAKVRLKCLVTRQCLLCLAKRTLYLV